MMKMYERHCLRRCGAQGKGGHSQRRGGFACSLTVSIGSTGQTESSNGCLGQTERFLVVKGHVGPACSLNRRNLTPPPPLFLIPLLICTQRRYPARGTATCQLVTTTLVNVTQCYCTSLSCFKISFCYLLQVDRLYDPYRGASSAALRANMEYGLRQKPSPSPVDVFRDAKAEGEGDGTMEAKGARAEGNRTPLPVACRRGGRLALQRPSISLRLKPATVVCMYWEHD